MATTYALHYSRKAGEFSMYDPRISPFYLAPICKIRGRKDVTSDASKVTCGACAARIEATR